MHAIDRSRLRRAARPAARLYAPLGATAALLLAAFALPAQAIVHDRLPGDDAGGSSTLPVPAAGERAAAARTRTGETAGARVVDGSE